MAPPVAGLLISLSLGLSTAAPTAAPVCVVSGLLQACAPRGGGPLAFAVLRPYSSLQAGAAPRTIVSSSALVATSHRIEFGTGVQVVMASSGHALLLTVPDEALHASYTVRVDIADGKFDVSVNAVLSATPSPPPPPPTPPPGCTAGPINSGLNPGRGDLRHFRQPSDSPNPALCRAACCNATDCDVWTLMSTGEPGLGAPCVKGKPCCYLKNAAAGAAVRDPNCIASGGKHAEPSRAGPALHNLELEYTFNPPHAATDEEGAFKWMPNLHRGTCLDSHQQGTSCWYGNDTTTLTTEHFFRSPAVIGVHSGDAFAVLPDIALLSEQQLAQPPCSALTCTDFDPDGGLLPQALDLHAGVRQQGGNAPPLGSLPMIASHGVSSSHRVRHEYGMRDEVYAVNLTERTAAGPPLFRASLFIWGGGATPAVVLANVTSFLWRTHGHRHLVGDIRPQIMPFDLYPKRFSYNEVLFDPTIPSPPKPGTTCAKATAAVIDGHQVWGIANMGRDGANFHAWENDACNSFGIAHYGAKWKNAKLRNVSMGMVRLSTLAPLSSSNGAFPSIYNFVTGVWEGTIPFANPSGAGKAPTAGWGKEVFDAKTSFDNSGMGVTAWWQLYHLQHLSSTLPTALSSDLEAKVSAYGGFVQRVMLPNGAVPSFFHSDGTVFNCGARADEGGCVSATSAISGAVLAKLALTNSSFTAAAVQCGEFSLNTIIPTLAFYDFETFFSCNNKPVNWTDTLNGMKAINTLSVGWTADQMLALYALTKNETYLEQGELVLAVFNLFQQVWSPPRYEQRYGYLFGGFGAGNTDGEWSDREHRAVPTLADYFSATGKTEYLERAVAATRASFGLMHMPPNYLYNTTLQPDALSVPRGTVGYSPENILHGGEWDGFSGFNWGGGGAATAAAYLELRFGGALINVAEGTVAAEGVGIDGVAVEVTTVDGSTLAVKVSNALSDYGTPDHSGRTLLVTIRCRAPCVVTTVVLNGVTHSGQTTATLAAGLPTTV
jgi:hypothetical protein